MTESTPGIGLRDVDVTVARRQLLTGISLSVEPGEFLALVGPNGAGKTTLLRTALGLVRCSRGNVRVGGSPVETLAPRERAALLAWLPQQTLVTEALSALETVVAARYRFDETRAHAEDASRRCLARLGVLELEKQEVTRLSGGERQRVALAALIAQEAKLVLLDEPANHLDPAQQAETYALLGALVREGTGILCVTHDVNLLAHAGGRPRVTGLAGGKLAFETDYRANDLPERLAELFGVPMDAVEFGARRLIVPNPQPKRAP
jgi:ABC-type cobalamin/Fe3+-siderophores transport system ATPase subunit